MLKVKELSPLLKPLELIGLQYFSANKINVQSNSIMLIPSKWHIIYFSFRLLLFLLGTSFTWFHFYAEIQNKSFEENIVTFIFKGCTVILSTARMLVAFTEALIKVKSNQKFLILYAKLCDLMESEFKLNINLKMFKRSRKFKLIRILIAAVFLVIAGTIGYIGCPIPHVLILALNFCINFTTIFLILYKFCFYVDLIGVCLKSLLDILDDCSLYRQNKELLLNKIYQVKRIYIYIIKMNNELNCFMSLTISTYTICEFMWILTHFHQIFRVYLGDVDAFKSLSEITIVYLIF